MKPPIDSLADAPTKAPPQSLAECYREALASYLQQPGEEILQRGYELGRDALARGASLLELVQAHHQALQEMTTREALLGLQAEPARRAVAAAGDFLAECLSPYEMSHRGAQEGTRALRRLNEVMESEIKRIAHALHDDAGQLLVSLHLAVADIARELPMSAQWRVAGVERLFQLIETELRDLSHELRPSMLDNLGLQAALEFLAESLGKRTGLAISVGWEVDARLPPAVETALYRSVQEALNNVVRHAGAQSVRIDIQHTPPSVSARISDDGTGFDASVRTQNGGLGLIGIRERLQALGGTLAIISVPGNGTTLAAEIPLADGPPPPSPDPAPAPAREARSRRG